MISDGHVFLKRKKRIHREKKTVHNSDKETADGSTKNRKKTN